MSNPLLPRELCRFRIEATEIVISEKKHENSVVKDLIHAAYSKYFDHKPDAENEIQWFAEIGPTLSTATLPKSGEVVDVELSAVVAYAYLHGPDEEVEFSMIVHPDYRTQGLGTVMLRMAHDMAIRHHKKVITCVVPDGALRSTKTFEREGFDFVRDDMAMRALGRKEIG